MKINLLLFVFLSLVGFVPALAAQLISETVGSVHEEALTSREMVLSNLIEAELSKKSEAWPMSQDQQIQAVNTLLLDKMVELEADELGLASYDKSDFENSAHQIEKEAALPKYKNYHWSKKEIQNVLVRKLRVRSFLKSKSDSFASLLTDQDLMAYYEKNRVKFGSVPFKDIKENIRTFLLQQQRDERLKTWIDVLKKKYKARNYFVEKKKQ